MLDLWILKAKQASLTRAAMVDAAVRVAAAEGFDAVTTRRVARESGFSTGAVHHHFKSVDELREAVLEEWCAQVGEIVLLPAIRAANGIARIWAIAEGWLAWAEALPLGFHALSAPHRRGAVFNSVDRLAADWFEVTRAAFQRSRHLGEIYPESDPLALSLRIHEVMWSSNWAWAAVDHRTFIEAAAMDIFQTLAAAATSIHLLPEFPPRLAMILEVAEPLSSRRSRPDPNSPSIADAAGMYRLPYEDLLHPDDPERIEWEERHGRPVRSAPLPDEPAWWLHGKSAGFFTTEPTTAGSGDATAEAHCLPPSETLGAYGQATSDMGPEPWTQAGDLTSGEEPPESSAQTAVTLDLDDASEALSLADRSSSDGESRGLADNRIRKEGLG